MGKITEALKRLSDTVTDMGLPKGRTMTESLDILADALSGEDNPKGETVSEGIDILRGVLAEHEGSGGGGGGDHGDRSDPIRFFDYEGTLVASYTEVPDALPECPTHEGLVSQGWNYTLEEVQTQFEAVGLCDVGHLLVTDDGATRVYANIPGLATRVRAEVEVLDANAVVTMDFGDGSNPVSAQIITHDIDGGGAYYSARAEHTYTQGGDKVISITGDMYAIGNASNSLSLVQCYDPLEPVTPASITNGLVRRIEIGSGMVVIGPGAFYDKWMLESVSVSRSTVIYNYGDSTADAMVFGNNSHLKCFVFPPAPEEIMGYPTDGKYALPVGFFNGAVPEVVSFAPGLFKLSAKSFMWCYPLTGRLVLPDGLSWIDSGALESALTESIIIPPSVELLTSPLGTNGDMNPVTTELHFKSTVPPELNDGIYIASDFSAPWLTIYVPSASVEAYKVASGWSTYADQIVGE